MKLFAPRGVYMVVEYSKGSLEIHSSAWLSAARMEEGNRMLKHFHRGSSRSRFLVVLPLRLHTPGTTIDTDRKDSRQARTIPPIACTHDPRL